MHVSGGTLICGDHYFVDYLDQFNSISTPSQITDTLFVPYFLSLFLTLFACLL